MLRELGFSDIKSAANRIKNHIKITPVISNPTLNSELGVEIFLKLENLQVVNTFKARGVFNTILAYQEKHQRFPEKIVASSSGNHAQAVAFACKNFGIPALIYMASIASKIKIAATKSWGAEVILNDSRSEVNRLSFEKQNEGYFLIHPSDNDDVICGQGTAAFEALSEIGEVAAIFVPCGGGGLLSGSLLAASELSSNAKVFGCEPLNGNDVARSLREGKIFSFAESPNTVADGARTLATSERCFNYIKKTDGILEIPEEEIIFWQRRVSELLGMKIEPTSALTVAGISRVVKKDSSLKGQKILTIISGGNC